MGKVIVTLCMFLSVSFVSCQFGYYQPREERRYGSPFRINFVQQTSRLADRFMGTFQRPQSRYNNPEITFPYEDRRPMTYQPYNQNTYYNPGNGYGQYNQYNPYEQNNGYSPNTQMSFPTSDPTKVNFVNNYNEPSAPSEEPNNFNNGIPNVPPSGGNIPSGIGAYSNVPPSGAVNFSNVPPSGTGAFSNVPPAGNVGFPNVPPSGSGGFSNVSPNGNVGFPNMSPTGTDGISNVPPTGNVGFPNVAATGAGGFSNVPPTGNVGFPNVPPSGAGGLSNVARSENVGFPDVPPSTAGGFSNLQPTGQNGIPNVPQTADRTAEDAPVNFNDRTSELPELTPVPEFEKRNNFNFGSAGLFKETCTTVDQGVGSCISLLKCSPYLKIAQNARNDPNAVNILRRSHCGFEGNNPKVCCPLPSIPPIAPPTTTTTAAPTTTTTLAPSVKAGPEDFVAALPDPPMCGVSNASFSRVVGGVKAKLGDFPWMALLGYKNRRGPGARWLCGGSLITSKHVLTAAHCINGHEDDLFLVRLGELDLEKEDEGATPVDVPIKLKIKHEEYSGTAFTSDIGILVLENEVTFTDLIKPICIPKDSELRARSFEDYNPIIAGWGDTEFRGPSATHLQALQLPVVSNDYCKSAYSQYKKQTIDERVLCAGYKKGGKDACQGDSGGPLMQPIWNQLDYTTHFYQIGVVSFGKKCAEAGFPGVYSRVTHFVPWIESKVLGVA